jgi:hypothetical protein
MHKILARLAAVVAGVIVPVMVVSAAMASAGQQHSTAHTQRTAHSQATAPGSKTVHTSHAVHTSPVVHTSATGHASHKTHGHRGNSPQPAVQSASAGQQATALARSVQAAPSVNLPVALLSFGSNNGSVTQAPLSAAVPTAVNSNGTSQLIAQPQQGQGSGSTMHKAGTRTHQGRPVSRPGSPMPAVQSNAAGQQAAALAKSLQVAPSVNLPVAVLAFGSNNGGVTQAPSSVAMPTAANINSTLQQIVPGL